MTGNRVPMVLICMAVVLAGVAHAQQTALNPPTSTAQDSNSRPAEGSGLPGSADAPKPKAQSSSSGQQTRRILGIIPNYRSVSADTRLAPLSSKEKLWLATQDSFDYSSFAYVGILTGITTSQNPQRSFGDGFPALADYYAHNFADNTIENYQVEAFVPILTKEDPRYYTLGHGGILKRTGYAVSRLLITRKDSGGTTPNLSEIIGAGAAAGISNIYYPAEPNPWVKTYQLWISEVAQDGLSNIAKEFWPDINRAFFHDKY